MLKERLKGKLPYPPEDATIVIYNFIVDENNGEVDEEIIYNSLLNRFEYPMNRLTSEPLFWYGTKLNGEVNWIKGTNIYWKVENDLFIFWFEDDLFSALL